MTKQRVNNSPCNQSYPPNPEIKPNTSPFALTTLHRPLRTIFPSGPTEANWNPNFNRRISQRVSSKDERAPASRSWASRIDPGNKRRGCTPNRAEQNLSKACKSLPLSPFIKQNRKQFERGEEFEAFCHDVARPLVKGSGTRSEFMRYKFNRGLRYQCVDKRTRVTASSLLRSLVASVWKALQIRRPLGEPTLRMRKNCIKISKRSIYWDFQQQR